MKTTSVTCIVLAAVVLALTESASAWPWDKRTDTVVPRATFLASMKQAQEVVQKAVELSHATIKKADEDQTEAKMDAQVNADVRKFFAEYRSQVTRYADKTTAKAARSGSNVAAALTACVDQFDSEIVDISGYMTVDAMNRVSEDMKNVRDTATSADALLAKIDDVVQRAQELASRSDKEYAAGVNAIIKEAEDIESTAKWNNGHIDTVIYDLKWSTDMATQFTTVTDDVEAIVGYVSLCMRRGLRHAQDQH